MRSELVFQAGRHMQNRFLLCHWVRVASRRFHKSGEPIQETISKVLALVTEQQLSDLVEHPGGSELEVVSSVPRRAATRSSSPLVSEAPIRNVG
ncbi:MAG: DNA-directed RNA polymerase subunit omega [Terriglobales bacterium]